MNTKPRLLLGAGLLLICALILLGSTAARASVFSGGGFGTAFSERVFGGFETAFSAGGNDFARFFGRAEEFGATGEFRHRRDFRGARSFRDFEGGFGFFGRG